MTEIASWENSMLSFILLFMLQEVVLGSKRKIGKEIILHSRSRVYSAIKQMENKYLQLTRVIRKCETKERWLIGSSTKQGPVRRQLQLQLFNKVLRKAIVSIARELL